ncbi:MAG: DUF6901 family protein [Candidatus Anammoxibacter sp.]
MESTTIRYSFKFENGSSEIFDFFFSPKDIVLKGKKSRKMPSWTKLDFHQCSNCPLSKDEVKRCPLSVSLVNIVSRFSNVVSYEKVHIDCITKDRTISQDTTVQRGLSSFMGLVIATSGCPHTWFFRPMAHFHLPVATFEETIYRATSTYLLGQYFLNKSGRTIDIKLKGLEVIYQNMHIVNTSVVNRLQSACKSDSVTNAITLLDAYASILPIAIQTALKKIRHLFKPFFLKK